jgi:general secretion pathway protein D
MDTFANRHSEALVAVCIAALIGLVACTGVAQAAGEPAAQEQRPINIDVRDMAVSEVLRMLGQAGNVNIIVGEGVTGRVKSLTLRDVPVEAAIRRVAEAHGCYWRLDDNVYLVSDRPLLTQGTGVTVRPEPGEVEGEEGQPPEGTGGVPPPPVEPPYTLPPGPPGGTEPPFRTERMPLTQARADEIALMFGGTVVEARMPTGFSLGPHPGTGLAPLAARGAGGLLGPSMGVPGTTGLDGTGLGQFQPGGVATGTGPLGGGIQPTTGTTGTTTGTGAGLLPDGIDSVTAVMRDNVLLVRGTPAAIDEFREILAMLDTPAKQVEIATKWIEVATTASKALGIDWAVSNGALEFWNLGFAPGEAGNNGVRYGRGRFWAELAVLENTGQAMIVNEPRVTCTNGDFGSIAFQTQIPYFSATVSYNQFGQRTVDFTADFVQVSNQLMVQPIIYPDDTIEMYLSPQLQDQVGTVEGPNGERIPIITSQFVQTRLRVKDGETFVLGGVVRKDESINLRKTPFLADIPIIGKLFQSKRTEKSNTELLIFVTPRIIRAPEAD